ncbi:MAG TPA: hypothetical protein VGJ72_15345 [Polaromonas sp.]|jgi:conjugal transfer/entry exclusion protein
MTIASRIKGWSSTTKILINLGLKHDFRQLASITADGPIFAKIKNEIPVFVHVSESIKQQLKALAERRGLSKSAAGSCKKLQCGVQFSA